MSKRRSSELTVTDQFCGAGGSSIGAEMAGATLVTAVNHWRLAIETHATNFPTANHDCADISQVDPRRYPSTDILITSPECTNHTTAKNHRQAADELKLWNPKDEAERSRATMWDVPRFAECHNYKAILVENVVEARSWRPFESWLSAMHSMDYEHDFVYLNSMFTPPVPQSRDRLYTIFWKSGNPKPDLEYRPQAWCPDCEKAVESHQVWKTDFDETLAKATKRNKGKRPDRIRWGLYGQQYDYRCVCGTKVSPLAYPALTAIDWSYPSQRIGDRAQPLAEATMARIARGLERYGNTGVLVPLHHSNDPSVAAKPLDRPFPTQTGRADQMLAHPFLHQLAGHAFERENSTCRSRSVTEPMRTMTGTMSEGVVLVPMPMMDTQRNHGVCKPVTEPTEGVTAGGNHLYLVEPARDGFVIKNYGAKGGAADWMIKSIKEPLGTVTVQDHHGLVQVPMVDTFHGNGSPPAPVTEPLTTATGTHRHALVEPTSVAVEDCYYRMLEPAEIGRAMSFPDDYTVVGSKRDKVRQYGNAVTPPAMAMLMERTAASLN